MSKKKLTVADFFCGAGGFSEGFHQMGLDVVFALDNWQPAVSTHKLNHPDCKTKKLDILDLDTPEKIDQYVPDVDVLIGSPPCVSFSGSNKAGKADKSLGIRLIEAYLRIVAWKMKKGDLKYWILENVPNSHKYIQEKYTWEELELPGKGPDLLINDRAILNAADFGSPQNRIRFFCGKYPIPEPTVIKEKYVTMKDVLDALTNPYGRNGDIEINDPCYNLTLKASELTDHFYDTRIAEFEWKKSKRLKVDHGFMGKMSFPENLDRTSRTVMATRSASTREAIIFDAIDKKGKHLGYRLPTIREIASFMSFPITYQFEAQGEGSKYRLVGNAVCVKMAAALANEINKKEEIKPVKHKFEHVKTKYDLTGSKRIIKARKNRALDAKFARHIPYLKLRSFRVDLTNIYSNFKEGNIVWECIVHQGSGKNATKCNSKDCDIKAITKDIEGFTKFIKDVKIKFSDIKLTHLQLHQAYIYVNSTLTSPEVILEQMKKLIDKHFNDERLINNEQRFVKIDRDVIPIQIIAGLFACDYFVQKLL